MTSTLRSSDGRVIVPERLRRRRAEVRRGQGRRRLRRVVAFAALAAILAAGWAALRSPLLAVDDVVVTGSSHVGPDEVASVSGIEPGVAMMDVSPARARRALEASPWVARATVAREWPNRVRIEVVDREPVAQVASGSRFALVDATGRVLQVGIAREPGLPLLEGHHATRAGSTIRAAAPLLETAAGVPADYRGEISGIGVTEQGSVALTLTGDGVVTIGRSEGFGAKFASLTTVLDHLGGLHAGCTLDVSVPASPTLTPEYGCV